MPRRGTLTPEERQAMAEQTAAEKRRELEEKGEFVSPLQEEPPRMTDSEVLEEAKRIFEDDLVDPAEVEADIQSLETDIQSLMHITSLHRKLAKIRAEFGFIGKTGRNTGVGAGYKFVEATEISRRFVQLASEHNITMLPRGMTLSDPLPTPSGKQMVWTIVMDWQITDADTGEVIYVTSAGQGADQADKALPKAQTNAMKYAILMVLQAAGDDPENDPRTDQIENTPNTDEMPGITITGSDVAGVRQGGRQSGATEAQLSEVKRLAGSLYLDATALSVIINQAIGKMPSLPEGGSDDDEKRSVVEFLGALTFDECAEVIRALRDIPPPSTEG